MQLITYTITFHKALSQNINFNPANYSASGSAVLSELQNLIAAYDPDNDQQFFSSLQKLKTRALTLSGDEMLKVGIPVSVAINSFTYWKPMQQNGLHYFRATNQEGSC